MLKHFTEAAISSIIDERSLNKILGHFKLLDKKVKEAKMANKLPTTETDILKGAIQTKNADFKILDDLTFIWDCN